MSPGRPRKRTDLGLSSQQPSCLVFSIVSLSSMDAKRTIFIIIVTTLIIITIILTINNITSITTITIFRVS